MGVGYANLVSDVLPSHGVVLSAEASMGLDDIWTVRAGLALAQHPANAPVSVMLASAELLYLIDVFELVPYFGAGVDGIGTLHAGALGTDLGVHPVLGLDWLPSRDLVFGLAVRPIVLVSALDQAPVYFTFALTASMLFDL
jgi:hypothetical protein